MNMKEVLIKEYSNLKKLSIPSKELENTFNHHFIKGAFLEILGDKHKKFLVEFINQDSNKIIYSSEITTNMWTKCNIQYYINWKIKVTDLSTNEVVFEKPYNAENKRVYIHLDSKALGDTLAWFPYIEEFRKLHKCEVVVSTFHNSWFKSEYPELEFIEPGTVAHNLYAQYSIGWHYKEDKSVDFDKNPLDFRKLSLQETCSSILGTTHAEIRPKLAFKKSSPNIEGKYVCIAPHASAHAKYWNYGGGWEGPTGWQIIIDYLNNKGYKVVMITLESLGDSWHDSKIGGTLQGVIDKTGEYSLEDRANDIMNADLFIGLGSGLSWLSWALNTPTVLISGFSKPYSEFKDCSRVFTPSLNICNGCFNTERLDPGDWEWCPKHRDTDRMFECTKTITPDSVIKAIETQLLNKN